MCGPVGAVAWQLFKDEDSSSRMVIFSVFYSVRQWCMFDPEIISPQNFFWPWILFDEHIWFLAISGAYRCWRTKRRWGRYLPHTLLKMTDSSVLYLSFFFFNLSHPPPPSFYPPPPPPSPWPWGLWGKERWMVLFWTVTRLHASHSIIIHK